MRKSTSRILSMLMVLAMVLSILPASVFATGEAETKFEGWSVTLGEDIGVNFYFTIADADVANAAANISVAGNATTVNASGATKQDGYYIFTANVAAAQMTDTISMELIVDGTSVHSGTYSVRQYAESILTGEYDDEVKQMVKEMLNYGAAAQNYFAYNTENLANAGYVLESAATVPTEIPEISVEDNLKGMGLYGMSLLFKGKTAVRFYFQVSGDISTYTFKVGETAYEPTEKDGLYYVEVGNINPQDLDKMITVVVSKGEEQLSVSYSPLTYITRKYNSDSTDSLKALVQALYGYHLEAVEYKKYQQIIQVGTLSANENTSLWCPDDNHTYIYFNTAAYTATTGEYSALTADAVKLVRGGETYDVANVGQGLIVNENGTQHLLKLAPWSVTGDHLPLQAHDYFIIEGRFESTSGDGTTIQIAKSYIYYDGTSVEVSTTVPVLPTVVSGGLMQTHSNSHADYGIYFAMDANDAPYKTDWSMEYTQTSVDNIKLIRDGETISIGIVDRPLIIKYGETDHYLKLEKWNVGDVYGMNGGSAPITTDDIIIIEGDFAYAAEKVTLNIQKSYVYYNGTAWVCSAEEPVLDTTVDVVSLSSHSNGWNSTSAENPGGLTFAAAENDAPYATDWSLRYTPVSSDVIKLVRDGVETDIANTGAETIIKYSATEYYLEFWPFSQKPMLAGDEIIIEGLFYNAANKTYINIEKTCLICNDDGTVTVITGGYINAGYLSDHSNGMNGTDGIYATMTANSAPYDGWNIEYAPLSEDAYYVIRDGEQINIGKPGRGTLVKYSDTEYYLKLTQWCTDSFAFTTNDIIVIDGFWKQNTGGSAIMKIEKTYLYYDGSAWTFSTTEPTLPTTVEGGVMMEVDGYGWTGSEGNLIFKMENTAPTGGYAPTSASNIQLIRDGQTYDVGYVGVDVINKDNDGWYTLAFWTIVNYKPMLANDILVIEGAFCQSSTNTTLNISKTYVLLNADGSAEFSTEMPIIPTTVEGGVMTQVDGYGWTGETGDLIFKMENTAPTGGYAPTSASNIQLIRNGETYDVGYVGVDVINKDNDGWYTLAFWTIVNYKPMLANDILVVEGDFYQSGTKTTLNVSKTYVLLNADGSATFSTEMPTLTTVIDGGLMQTHSNGMSGNGIYFTMAENDAPYNTDWTLEYTQTSADNIKLIRDGETISIGIVGRPLIIKYGASDYYLKLEGWNIGDYGVNGQSKAITTDDIIIVEGSFEYASEDVILNITKSYVYYNGTAWVCSDSAPSYIDAGPLGNHSNGINGTDGIYATMTANSAPYDSWSIEYAPVSADCYYVIRNDEQINIGKPGRGTLVKYSDTEYYLKLTQWCTDNFAFTTDDIFVIEGLWKQNTGGDATLKIEKTYLYHDGSAWIFATELPAVVNAGLMQTHSNGMSGNGIYFTMAENDAPYNTDWTLEYTQTSADNIKLIRDGETISIGIVGRPLIIKYGASDYYLKLEGWNIGDYGVNGQSSAITTDDIIIVEGSFEYDNVTLNITKSYVYYDGTAWVCSAEAPVQKNIVDLVDLDSHAVNGWTSNGFYFVAPENDAPFNTEWSLRYTPVSADAIKLVHEGVTTNKGNTAGETIIKYSATEYYIEGWAVGMSSVVAGDQMIIEGQFYNAANDTYINIEKTYFTFNADGTVSVISEKNKYIHAGAMSAYETGWFNNGFYFAMESNDLPYNAAQEDWSTEYAPTSTAAIKLIRDGVTTDSARVGAGTIIKLADGQYYMKIEGWTITSISSKDDLLDGDILVIEGDFFNESNGYTLHIDKSYITLSEGKVIFSAAANTDFGEVLLPNSADTLTIGMWNGSYHVFEDKQLKELQAAGITKIVGIDTQWIGTTDVNAWLDRVYSYGIRIVFDLRGWDGETVPDYASHPGVLGFLMWDEPCTTDFDTLADLKAKFDAIGAFNGKLFYVNLLASCVADSSLFGESYSSSQTDYDTYYVTEFLNKLDIQVLSWDNYSLISQADDTTAKGIRTDYFYNFEVMASKASDNLPLWYIMLSAGHNSGAENTIYNTPTAEELRWQMAVALTYGVQNIDHYVYVSHESDYSSMVEYDTWEPTALYYDIKTVDNEYLAWDNIFMAYDWVGVGKYSANSKDTMLDQLENCLTLSNYGIASVSASENLLVGVFDYNGDKAYMVTNAGSTSTSWFTGDVGDGREFNMADSTVTLTLDAADYKCVAVIDNGQISYVAVENNTVTLNVEAYEGVFVIPVLN